GMAHDVVGSNELLGDLACELGFPLGIDQYGMAKPVVDLCGCPIARGLGRGELGNPLLQERAYIGVEGRTLRPSVVSLAITFMALPPLIVPTVTTAICVGLTFLATTVCSARTMLAAATIGSTAWCGRAAWPPTPFTVIVTRS